ncbi:hypothetical protein ACLB2K_058685 [Fragaria x ananassa]
MVPVLFLLHVITLFLWPTSTSAKAVTLAKPKCTPNCGVVQIPYPFGIEEGCYIDWFRIQCYNFTGIPTPTLWYPEKQMSLEVLNISVEGTLTVRSPITFLDPICGCPWPNSGQPANLSGSPFVFSQKNRLAVMGCGGTTWMTLDNGSRVAGCPSVCGDGGKLPDTLDRCNGINCCQINTPPELTAFNYTFEASNKTTPGTESCKYAFLVDQESWVYDSTGLSSIKNVMYIPVLLDWNLNRYSTVQIYGRHDWTNDSTMNCTSAHQCACSRGYQGNPYLIDGCRDVDECEDPFTCGPLWLKVAILVISCVLGLLFLHGGTWWSYKVIKKRKNIKRKQKFFKQNGGLLLQQQSSSGDQTSIEKLKLFHSEELEKATDGFNADRILGRGGQGTVYKGMLADGKIVAVKKSLLANGSELRQFINEIVILSQIIHRNVVKLWGCCLETEVPLLVYEFIPNGTLSHYIQHENEDFPLTWGIRLRVAKEVAGALSYLHSAATTPIYHRDIKSSNILLDDKYTVKVADFGTSRSVSIDKTHLTLSQVQGTFGYLDPEYFQTSQFTDKSDVYSFGVVLAELLTGKKPIFQTKSQETMSLSHYFLVSMEENRLSDILDARVMNSEKKEVMAVANLAMRCLNMKGKERPAMKEVVAELEAIFKLQGEDYNVQRNTSDVGYVRSGITEVWDVGSTSVSSSMVTESSGTSSFDLRPLVSIKTE